LILSLTFGNTKGGDSIANLQFGSMIVGD